MFRYSKAAVLAALFATPLTAHDYTIDALTVAHPYARATTPTAQMAGGFMTITNTGEQADRLIGVEVDFARGAEIHLTQNTDGVMQMRELENGLEIPAGESVELMRGSFHLMFMGLEAGLVKGDRLDATLIFDQAGPLSINFTVESFNFMPEHGAGAMDEMDHGDMDAGHDHDG